MRKNQELHSLNSCLSKARYDEMLFVLRGKDQAAPFAIQAWIAKRLELGLNLPGDRQIIEAEECARVMETESQGTPPPDQPSQPGEGIPGSPQESP